MTIHSANTRDQRAARILVTLYLLSVLATLIANIFLDSDLLTNPARATFAITFTILGLASTVFIIRTKARSEPKLKWWLIAVLLLATIPISILGTAIVGPIPQPQDNHLPTTLRHLTPLILLYGIATSWVIAPLTEEWIFRGYLLPESATWSAVAVNALIFTLAHSWSLTDPEFAIRSHAWIFVIGFALATVKKITRSTWTCVLLHAAFNISAVSISIR